jgi:hypothetical protein
MLFSFATFAVSLWLGLVAVACLHRLWRAAASEGGGYGSRNYPRATGGENHHRDRDGGSDGPISVAHRSLVSVSCAVVNVIQAGLSRAIEWVSKIFRLSRPSQSSGSRLSSTTVDDLNCPSASQQISQSNGSVVSVPPRRQAGPAQRKRARRTLKETQEPRLKSAEPRLRKNDNQPTEKVARMAPKLRKDHSAKKSQKTNTAVTKTAKKITRTKGKVSLASNSSLTPKVSV